MNDGCDDTTLAAQPAQGSVPSALLASSLAVLFLFLPLAHRHRGLRHSAGFSGLIIKKLNLRYFVPKYMVALKIRYFNYFG